MRKPRINIIGQTFGRLTAIEYVGDSRWRCACSCGQFTTSAVTKLRSGYSASCGCISTERIAALNRTLRPVKVCACGDHVFTDLTRGFVGLLSPEDRHLFDDASWNAHRGSTGAWSVTGTYAKKLHRVVLGVTDPAIVVDHKNGNTFDNRRNNLRPCSNAKNVRNQKRRRTKVHSRFKGVTKSQSAINPWFAQIQADGVHVNLGLHQTEEAAARAYDEAAKRLHGEFALTNKMLGLL